RAGGPARVPAGRRRGEGAEEPGARPHAAGRGARRQGGATMKRLSWLLLACAGCAGSVHMYDKAGSYTGQALSHQAERREVPSPKPLSGLDVQIAGQNYVATFERGSGGGAPGQSSPAPASGGSVGAGMAGEAGGGATEIAPPPGR